MPLTACFFLSVSWVRSVPVGERLKERLQKRSCATVRHKPVLYQLLLPFCSCSETEPLSSSLCLGTEPLSSSLCLGTEPLPSCSCSETEPLHSCACLETGPLSPPVRAWRLNLSLPVHVRRLDLSPPVRVRGLNLSPPACGLGRKPSHFPSFCGHGWLSGVCETTAGGWGK